MIPGRLARITQQDGFDVSQGSFDPPPKNVQEIHAAFEQSVRDAEERLTGMIEEKAPGEVASNVQR